MIPRSIILSYYEVAFQNVTFPLALCGHFRILNHTLF